MYYLLAPNSPAFARFSATGAGPYKHFSFVSRHKLSHVRGWCWRDTAKGVAHDFPASLTGILMGGSPAIPAGNPAGGFLHSSPGLWYLSEPLSHPVAIATPAPLETEFQLGLEEEKLRRPGGVFQVAPSLHTILPPLTVSGCSLHPLSLYYLGFPVTLLINFFIIIPISNFWYGF